MSDISILFILVPTTIYILFFYLNSCPKTYRQCQRAIKAKASRKSKMGKDKTLPLLDHRDPPELTETKSASKVWAKEFGQESGRLWQLAGPAIFTAISQYSLGALTQTFCGRLGELDLAAVSVENSVISGLAFGVMVRYFFSTRVSFLFFSCYIVVF